MRASCFPMEGNGQWGSNKVPLQPWYFLSKFKKNKQQNHMALLVPLEMACRGCLHWELCPFLTEVMSQHGETNRWAKPTVFRL